MAGASCGQTEGAFLLALLPQLSNHVFALPAQKGTAMSKLRFEAQDLHPELPAPGLYPAQIKDARFRRSANGNRMLQVVYALGEVSAAHARLSEYFVLEGGSAFGLARTRRRLVDLYLAAGLDPKPGDEIAAGDLVGAVLEVEVEHDQWQGHARLKVVGHRYRRDAGAGQTPF
jgi:hypothetical protein